MRNLVGMEMVCFGRGRHFELTYEGGRYLDDKGEAVEDVVDSACYVCSASFYTRESDAIGYCPNCGHIDRKRFDTPEALTDFLRGQDFSWLRRNGLSRFAVQTLAGGPGGGDWQLRFARDAAPLQASGRYAQVRAL